MLPSMQDDPFYQFKVTFFEECDELLGNMESYLTDLEEGDHDSELLNAIFRVVHSIKAGAGAFSFERMVNFTHRFEFLLDKLRDGSMTVDDTIVRVLFDSNDVLVDLVDFARNGAETPREFGAHELAKIEALINGESLPEEGALPAAAGSAVPEVEGEKSKAGTDAGSKVFEIDFSPKPSLFQHANEPLLIIRELSGLGDLKVSLDSSMIPELHVMEPEKSYFTWTFELNTEASRDDIDEVFEFVVDDCDLTIVEKDCTGKITGVDVTAASDLGDDDFGFFVNEEDLPGNQASSNQSAEPTVDQEDDDDFGFFVDVDAGEVEAGVQTNDENSKSYKADSLPVEAPASSEATASVKQSSMPQAPVPQTANAPVAEKPTSVAKVSSIRVDIDRVDKLVNMVGEIVITHSMLASELTVLQEDRQTSLGSGIEEMSMHIRELQDNVMAIRMQPVKSVFSRMPRIVRDVSKKLDKKVKLVTEGENTEVDKTVVEELADPLTHMIRNSLDHGLETPDERIAAGKPAEGKILLSAEHRGGRIVITIADDGRGINRPKVLELAKEKGVVEESQVLSDEEIDNLIFAPGFSTADEVTDLSGRGVGMDVVRRNIQSLGGRVSVVSEPGVGSRFQLTLPLTLAVLDGMVVGVGEQKFVIPINNIIETLRPEKEAIKTLVDGTHVIKVRGEYIRLVETRKTFSVLNAETDLSKNLVVLVEADGDRTIGIVVDKLSGQQQVVIKSLEANFGRVEGIASATILGNGSVCLILDIDGLADMDSSNQSDTAHYLKSNMLSSGISSDVSENEAAQ
ncbi:chemotaxis protein CheA [Temperatibacter marinus]|uniref:Chemotaxis protein CheA n=1 Tax=Temperatibacter marinus TaxID=1456591 RepID=A0AA52EGV5_9PROT|nr:chemotaxis protein CheA [Temperatibacter marinus]WND02099.1 chemotaxis protein CheA [Temperatibacter marinus]